MVTLLRSKTLVESADLARQYDHEAKFINGGTALVLMLQQGLIAPRFFISLREIDVPGWREITRVGDELRIGGGVSLSAVARSPEVRRHVPSLAQSASVVGNVRIRNVATMGGCVAEADYASDLPAVLVALEAAIEIQDGLSRRTLRATDMFTDFYTTALVLGEVVTGVRVRLDPGRRDSYQKFCSRSAEDRPCVGVATSLRLRDGLVESLGVVVGAVAGTPLRLSQLTDAAVGKAPTAALAAEVATDYAAAIDPLDDARGSAWYRKQVIRTLVRRGIEGLTLGAHRG